MNRELLYRFFKNEPRPGEIERVLDWLDADERNHITFETERKNFNSLLVNAPGSIEENPREKGKSVLGRVVKYAAAVAAVIVIALSTGILMRNGLRSELASHTTAIKVPSGQRTNLILQDGTSVWLNSGTEMEYPSIFDRERRVKIEGEAFFDVAHDPQKPFVVETFVCEVEALGTRFNVYADRNKGNFSATLLEGSVRVSKRDSDNNDVLLHPNHTVTLVGGRFQIDRIEDINDYRWPEGLINISNKSFEQLMRIFEKYYDVKIVIRTNELPEMDFDGKVRISDGINHAFEVLRQFADFTYERVSSSNLIYID